MKTFVLSLSLLIALCFVNQAFATTASEPISFAWEDYNMNKSVAVGYGWKIFQRAQEGSYDYNSPWVTVLYQNDQTTYTTTQQIMVTGNPGDTITLYWVARCFNNEDESADSNEISKSFVIPQDGFLYNPINFQILGQEAPDLLNIQFEFEDGTLNAPLVIISDLKSFNDKHIKFNTSNMGSSIFNFNVSEMDDYFLWARILAPDADANSVNVKMDSDDPIAWYLNPDSNWNWIRMNLEDTGNPGFPGEAAALFSLEAGDHVLEISSLEANVEVDRINITNDPDWEPSPDPDYIEIEAETAEFIVEPMQIVNTDYIGAPEGVGNAGGGYAEIPFEIVNEGEYIIWGLVMAPSGTDNSFIISINGEEEFNWHIDPPNDLPIWNPIHLPGEEDPSKFYLYEETNILKVIQREDGTLLDKVIITDKDGFDPTIEPTEEILALDVSLEMEAEDAIITAPFVAVEKSGASNGYCVSSPEGESGGNVLFLDFEISITDDYNIWARVLGPDGGANSLYYVLDGVDQINFSFPDDNQWNWKHIEGSSFNLSEGLHKIKFKYRESGPYIDKIIITNDLDFIPQD